MEARPLAAACSASDHAHPPADVYSCFHPHRIRKAEVGERLSECCLCRGVGIGLEVTGAPCPSRLLAGVISREEAVLRIAAANTGRFPAAMRRVRRAEAQCAAAGVTAPAFRFAARNGIGVRRDGMLPCLDRIGAGKRRSCR